MRALTLERWAHGSDTAAPLSSDTEPIPYVFTWTDTADPADLEPYAFDWETTEAQGDTAAANWQGGAKGLASGAGTGAAAGAAIGSIFPGIGTALGGAIGGAVGAIGGFFAGLFGGGKSSRPKPTPKWIVEIMEEGRQALRATPPDPTKMIDATLVLGGHMSQQEYERRKLAGELPSQRYAKNPKAAQNKGKRLNKRHGSQIAANLKHLVPGEKALVSAAMTLGQGTATLEALNKIRAQVEQARKGTTPPPFAPDALAQMGRQYLGLPNERRDHMPPQPPPEPLPRQLPPEPPPSRSPAPPSSPPSTLPRPGGAQAAPPTLAHLPKPAWHISPPIMPRHMFERLLGLVPAMQKIPQPLLRAAAGMGARVQDTAGVDPTTRQYLMMPGETFAGIARQLTGDARRAVELRAANPQHDPSRMRLHIPPGWIEWTPLEMKAEDTAGPPWITIEPDPEPQRSSSEPDIYVDDPPKKEEPEKKVPAKQYDGPRPNITKRIIEVLANDWPDAIASRTGAKYKDPQWFRTLRRANPHKVLGSDGNFATLYAGELLNYPDTWPDHIEAKPAPGQPPPQPPQPPPPQPPPQQHVPGSIVIVPPALPSITIQTGGTADPGSTLRAQWILAAFAARYPEHANPKDYGQTVQDLTGTTSERMRSILMSFQTWWNATRKPSPLLRVDGVLDPSTDAALTTFAEEAIRDAPNMPGGGIPKPTTQTPRNPGPFPPVIFQSAPAPREPERKTSTDKGDDSVAPLVVGGTLLSLFLR